MRNQHQILLQECGVEARRLFRDWERLQLKASSYKNHRIFTLRCLHKDLIPVSIKLKSTLKTEKARKIIRKAEKDLPQARVKAINSILDNVAKQTEECRSQLASIISAQRLRECQGFIDKVGEIRFTKVKQRQLNKYNILLNKNNKEGNITRANAITPTNSTNLASQAGRQASTLLPPGEGSNPSQAVRQVGALLPSGEGSTSSQAHLPPQEGTNLTQGRCSPSLKGREQFISGRQSGRALSFLLGKEAIYLRQAGTLLPQGEGSGTSQVTVHLPPGKKAAVSPRQLLTFLLGKEAVTSRQLFTFLPGKKAAVSPRQLLTFLLGKEAILCQELLTFLPGKEAVLPRPLLSFLPRKQAVLPRLLLTFPLGKEGAIPRQVL